MPSDARGRASHSLGRPLLLWLVVFLAVAVPVRFPESSPIFRHRNELLLWAYVLAFLAGVGGRREPLDHRGLDAWGLDRPRWQDLAWTAAVALAVLAPYAALYLGLAPRLGGLPASPAVPDALPGLALRHLLFVALPEELFFRGYLQSALDQSWRARLRVLGAPVGWGLPAAAALFALPHLVYYPPAMLLTFFPGLLFGWLRARTGRIWAPVLVHALCNLEAAALVG